MAVNFPDNPVLNQEFTSSNRTWIWDGSVWLLKGSLEISVQNLTDVTLLNLTNGQVLVYNSTTQKWQNDTVDVQGAIDAANDYTDAAVLNLTEYIDGFLDPSTGTTTEYIDQQDAATLAAANSYTDTAIDNLVGLAPETLDTLSEIAAAFNNDPDFLQNLDVLPSQTGNAGNFLTTDGATASWAPLDISATTVSEDPPLSPSEGDAWFRSSTGQFFVYYDSYWIEIGAGPQGEPGIVVAVSPLIYDAETQTISIDLSDYVELANYQPTILADTAPTATVAGTRWFKTTTGQEYIYYNSTWIEV